MDELTELLKRIMGDCESIEIDVTKDEGKVEVSVIINDEAYEHGKVVVGVENFVLAIQQVYEELKAED